MKTLAKWVLGLGIGVLFIWLSIQEGRFDAITFDDLRVQDWIVTTGDHSTQKPTQESPQDTLLETRDLSGWWVDLRFVLGYFAILCLIHCLRVLRWRPLLSPMEHVPIAVLNRIGGVGFMAVFLLPLRLGELVRPYLVSRQSQRISFSGALGTIAVERIFDGLLVSLLLSIVLFYLPSGEENFSRIQFGALVALSVFLLGAFFLVFLWRKKATAIGPIQKCVAWFSPSFSQRVGTVLESFLEGLQALPNPRQLLTFLFLTAFYWGINGVGVWILAKGFGLMVPLTAAYAMMACVVVGMMIPNSPGNVGTFWYFLLLPLTLYGFAAGDSQVTMFGLTAYGLQLFQQSSFGLWFLLTGGVRLADLSPGHADI